MRFASVLAVRVGYRITDIAAVEKRRKRNRTRKEVKEKYWILGIWGHYHDRPGKSKFCQILEFPHIYN